MVTLGKYRHFKGGEYLVEGIATHSETEEKMVVYRSVKDPSLLWIRPLSMWEQAVNHNGKLVPRFEKIKEDDDGSHAGAD